jgi:hypothetical protein
MKTVKLKAEKCFMIHPDGVEVPILIPRKQLRQAFKGKKVEHLEAYEKNKVTLSFQQVQGDKRSGPSFIIIDVHVSKAFLRRYSISYQVLTFTYVELPDITKAYVNFIHRLRSQEEPLESIIFGYCVICAIAQKAAVFHSFIGESLTEEMISVRQKIAQSLMFEYLRAYS